MLETIPDLPQHVLGVDARGRVSAEDYERVLIPAVEERLKSNPKLRLLYRLGPEFEGYTPGAMWDDARLGFAHWNAWEKIAVVTDVEWIRAAVRSFAFALPGEVRVFANEEFDAARAWVQS